MGSFYGLNYKGTLAVPVIDLGQGDDLGILSLAKPGLMNYKLNLCLFTIPNEYKIKSVCLFIFQVF